LKATDVVEEENFPKDIEVAEDIVEPTAEELPNE